MGGGGISLHGRDFLSFFGRVEEKGSHGWSKKTILLRGRLGREEVT